MSLIHGIAFGLVMILFIGPVFFTLLRASIGFGFSGGLTVATGIILSDILCILVCYFGAAQFIETEKYGPAIALLGAAILIGMGLKYVITRKSAYGTGDNLGGKDRVGLIIKGFLVNFVNPFVFLIWIGIITYARNDYGEGIHMILFILGILITIFSTDLLKSFYAAKLERIMHSKALIKVNLWIGIILIGFGIRMLWWTWDKF